MSDFETLAEVDAYYQGMRAGAGEYEREVNARKAVEAILADLMQDIIDCSIDDASYEEQAVRKARQRLKDVFDGSTF